MNQRKIAIQGIQSSWHDIAAKIYFGNKTAAIECDTFKILCEKLKSDEADNAVMAIENSIAGSLLSNYSLLIKYHLKIIGELFIKIQMHLLALPGTKIRDIKFIESHPIAILQCSDFLEKLKQVKIIEKEDTAKSAKAIRDQQLMNTAAIANIYAAQEFGLQVVKNNIESNKQNYTRFLVLAKEPVRSEKNNKASICFQLSHKVGSLVDVLMVFKENHLNLTKIQSVPIIGKPNEYTFLLDCEWKKPEDYDHAIKQVLKNVAQLTILGEYPKGSLDSHFTLPENMVNQKTLNEKLN